MTARQTAMMMMKKKQKMMMIITRAHAMVFCWMLYSHVVANKITGLEAQLTEII
jgi:hypothetical protein